MNIDLTSREVPPEGEQPGVFADVIQTVKTDKRGRNYSYLVLVGELAARKSSGKRFTATCSFNLHDARGLGNLRKLLQIWRNSDELPDLSGFDPEKEFINRAFLAKPTVMDKGGKRQIQFSTFGKCSDAITVSADFVRANATPRQA